MKTCVQRIIIYISN